MHKTTQHGQSAAVSQKKVLRPRRGADYLDVGLSTLWKFIKDGEIRTIKLGAKTTVIEVAELDRFLASKSTGGAKCETQSPILSEAPKRETKKSEVSK